MATRRKTASTKTVSPKTASPPIPPSGRGIVRLHLIDLLNSMADEMEGVRAFMSANGAGLEGAEIDPDSSRFVNNSLMCAIEYLDDAKARLASCNVINANEFYRLTDKVSRKKGG